MERERSPARVPRRVARRARSPWPGPTSSSAVSRATLAISERYIRTGSSVPNASAGSTSRSSAAGSLSSSAVGPANSSAVASSSSSPSSVGGGSAGGRRGRVRIGVGGRISRGGGEGARPGGTTTEGPGAGDLNLGERPRRSARHLSCDPVPPRPLPVDPTLRPPQLRAGIRPGKETAERSRSTQYDPAIAAIHPGRDPSRHVVFWGAAFRAASPHSARATQCSWTSRDSGAPVCGQAPCGDAFRTSILNPARGG